MLKKVDILIIEPIKKFGNLKISLEKAHSYQGLEHKFEEEEEEEEEEKDTKRKTKTE